MKKAFTPIITILILTLFVLASAVSLYSYILATQPTEYQVQKSREITAFSSDYKIDAISHAYSNNTLQIALRNTGSKGVSLDEEKLLFRIDSSVGAEICPASYLHSSKYFRLNTSQQLIRPGEVVILNIEINNSNCKLIPAHKYKYFLLLSEGIEVSSLFDLIESETPISIPSMSEAIITIEDVNVGIGESIFVDLNISNAVNVSAFEVVIEFNNTLIEVEEINFTNTCFTSPGSIFDNDIGRFFVNGFRLDGVDGELHVASIKFGALSLGTGKLKEWNNTSVLYDPSDAEIEHEFINASVNVTSTQIYYCSNCSDCSNKIQSAAPGSTVYLDSNITNHNGTCIEFNDADDIIFDCDGNSIQGDNIGSGIHLSNSSERNSILNCNIQEFSNGMLIIQSGNSTLNNISIESTNDSGIYMAESDHNQLKNINLINISQSTGITMYFCYFNEIENLTSRNNLVGISTWNFENNSMENITIINNSGTGISFIDDSQFNNLTRLTVSNNGGNGIQMSTGAGNNQFKDSSFCYNNQSTEGNYIDINTSDGSDIFTNVLCDTSDPAGLCDNACPAPQIYYCSNCSDCSNKIQSAAPGSTVYLDSNITNATGTCINFAGADEITFDCKGNIIDGTKATNSIGIYLSSTLDGSNGNSVNNCEIEEFDKGLTVAGSQDSVIENINISDSDFIGFNLGSSDNISIINLVSNITVGQGMWLSNASNCKFINITSNDASGFGIILETYSEYNNFTNVVSTYNGYEGIVIGGYSNNNTFTNFISQYNDGTGMHISGENEVINSYFCDNNQDVGNCTDLNDSGTSVFNNITCDTSDPNGLCDYSCSGPSGFTFQINTSLRDGTNTFEFQTDDAVNLFVDWGDGNNETLSDGTGLRSHTYSSEGIYNISLSGELSRLSFYEGTEDKLIDVLTNVSNGLTGITSSYQMFRGTDNFGSINFGNTGYTLTEPAFFDDASSNVIDMGYMFHRSHQFNQDISSWDVSSVIDMSHMFYNSPFNQDISSWDVSSVTDMEYMLDNTPMSINNYDSLLNGWNSLPSLQSGVTFGVQGLEYCAGSDARGNILDAFNWDFQGDQLNCSGVCSDVNAALYCSNAGGDTSYYNEYIERVQFEGIDVTSGNNNGYLDSTSSISDALTPGNSYTITITESTSGFYECFYAWFDWDQDLTFEIGERYDIGCGTDTVLSESISVPSGALSGSTMFRIVGEYNNYPSGPCTTPSYNEVEDYTVCVS